MPDGPPPGPTSVRHFVVDDDAPVEPRRARTFRIGDQVREIVDRLVATTAGEDDLAEMEQLLDGVVDRLRRFEHGRRYDSVAEAAVGGGVDGGSDTAGGHVDYSPLLGRANPIAPPLRLSVAGGPDDEFVEAAVTFGAAYEGPPGHVHGGVVAAAFDEVLGAVQTLAGAPGMTANLSVDYRAPTPLHRPLRFEGRIDRVDGRKIFTSGRLTDGDRLCAEATALFVSVDFGRIAAMRTRRDGD